MAPLLDRQARGRGAVIAVVGDRLTAERAGKSDLSAHLLARDEAIFGAAVAAALLFKLALAFRINVHWDELYFLSLVHDYLRGALASRLQTLHVHLFSWLAALGTDEAGEVIAGRVVMALVAAGSALAVYGIARRFMPRASALFGVLAYLSVSMVVEYGASFRADPLAVFLSLLALLLVLRRPGRLAAPALAGALMALAMMITIKSVFYAGVAALAIWCVGDGMRHRMRAAAAFALALGVVFALLYAIHAGTLPPAMPQPASGSLGQTASKMFLSGLLPRWQALLIAVVGNLQFFALLALGGVVAWRAARDEARPGGLRKWLPLVLCLPILTPLFYRNAFPYYYAFILPPGAVLAGLAYEWCRRVARDASRPRAAALVTALIVAQCVMLAGFLLRLAPDRIAPQRAALAAIHAMFPEPVHYIDGNAAVASFPWSGFFMSRWGIDNYRAAGRPVFADIVARDQPPLLIADTPSLQAALVPGHPVVPEGRLLPDDIAFLQAHYVQLWGMLFVPGRRFAAADQGDGAFDIAVAGDYRLEAAAAAELDGRPMAPGAVAHLGLGSHQLRVTPGTGEAVLRWAKAQPPAGEPVELSDFFTYRR
jgi:hypothetical protein